MGQSKSKALKYPHYPPPPGYPQYGHAYPYPMQPQVGYMSGYHGPQPVIPPGYGAPIAMPQPQIGGWTTQDRRRKKKKKRASAPPVARPVDQPRVIVQPAPVGMLDNLPPGFVPQNITPNPPGASSASYSGSAVIR